jgi:hypothetical protein
MESLGQAFFILFSSGKAIDWSTAMGYKSKENFLISPDCKGER